MSTTFRDISAALSGRLNTLTGGTPIAWENSEYTPTIGTMFLRETLLPANTVQGSLGTIGKDEHGGIYQVDIFAPSGSGKGAAVAKADSVADHFKRGTTLTYNGESVRIRNVSRSNFGYDGGWLILSINIEYFTVTDPR